ncbi:hypothetical protein PHET_02769 [Paragonimus heterotremus]|uniref:Transmembrane protein n=1 Tax=Paragonimus heterotremus TaxID=100268 RepID=A0A8J4TKU2_9TREM|nr:hypothetical protein PHET_02769 [Paragonimus heterotremus]
MRCRLLDRATYDAKKLQCVNARISSCNAGAPSYGSISKPPTGRIYETTVRRERSNWTTYLPWTALCLIPLILIFVLGMICTPRKSLDDFEDDGEADELKVNSPQTPSPSSMTDSSCSSPKSTRSAIVMKSQNPDLVRTQLSARCSSDPDSIAYALVTPIPLSERPPNWGTRQWNDNRTDDPFNTFGSKYATRDANKAVVPGLASRLAKAVRFQLTQQSDHNQPNNNQLKRPELDCRRFDHLRAAVNRTSRSRHFHKTSTIISGVENKMFVLPAEFELAALHVNEKHENHGDSLKTAEGRQSERGGQSSGYRSTSIGLPTRHAQIHPLAQFDATDVQPNGFLLREAGLTDNAHSAKVFNSDQLSVPDSSSTSTADSDREDVTPFRRPDHVGRDPLVNQTRVDKNQPNGFLVTSAQVDSLTRSNGNHQKTVLVQTYSHLTEKSQSTGSAGISKPQLSSDYVLL